MTQRASDLLAETADRLSDSAAESGLVAAEAVRAIEPEILQGYKDGSIDELAKMSASFLKALFRSLRLDAKIPWPEYYTEAREFARRYAEKGVPLESLMEGLAVFRRTVVARVTEAVGDSQYSDEVLLLAQSRLGDVIEHMNSSFIRGYLDYTEIKHRARQTELHGLYHIASALGRSLDVNEIAEVGLRETLKVLGLQAGAVWVREGARLKLAKTIGMQPGEEEEFAQTGGSGTSRVVEVSSGPAESRVDRVAGEWSAIRAELRTKGVLLGAMTVATRLPRTFEPSDLEFVAAVADHIAVSLDRARQHTKEARTDYLTGLANRPEFERAIDRAVASADRHKRRGARAPQPHGQAAGAGGVQHRHHRVAAGARLAGDVPVGRQGPLRRQAPPARSQEEAWRHSSRDQQQRLTGSSSRRRSSTATRGSSLAISWTRSSCAPSTVACCTGGWSRSRLTWAPTTSPPTPGAAGAPRAPRSCSGRPATRTSTSRTACTGASTSSPARRACRRPCWCVPSSRVRAWAGAPDRDW